MIVKESISISNDLKVVLSHLGDNKQIVLFALAIVDETTYAAIRSYYPHREDAAAFLKLISVCWTISIFFIYGFFSRKIGNGRGMTNSKVRYNTHNYLGNGITFLVFVQDN